MKVKTEKSLFEIIIKQWIGVLRLLGSVVGISGLVLEHGFVRPDPVTGLPTSTVSIPKEILHTGEYIAIICFVIALWVELLSNPERIRFLKEHLVELILSILSICGIYIILKESKIPFGLRSSELIMGLKIYLVLQLIIVFAKFNTWFIQSILHPARGIVIGFAMVILVGAFLLSLPCASYKDNFPGFGHNFVENLFTATSAVCVTGLIVRDTATEYTPFGQLVIMTLIQLGGLGIIIFGTIFAILVGRQISLKEASLVKDLYSEQALGQIGKIVKFIIFTTLAIEAIGAILLSNLWKDLPIYQRTFKSIFHSISAFCNAGFALQSDNMIKYANQWETYAVMLPLIVIGGLGFPVLLNLFQVIKSKFVSRPAHPDLDLFRVVGLTLHTKVVLITTAFLIVIGTIGIFLIEYPYPKHRWGKKIEYEDKAIKQNPAVMQNHPFAQRILDSLFLSVSARTAGFNTVDTSSGNLKHGTLLFIIALMFIGGSPASTAGGIKTVTFALLLATVYSALRRRPRVEMFKRTIDTPIVRRAIVVAVLFFVLVWVVWLALLIVQPKVNPFDLLFEAVSACGTVGYSTGITPHLNLAGRIVIIIAMFVGRLGPLTLLFSLSGEPKIIRYEYPRESLITG